MRYLDPKNDLTFRKIFGKHKHWGSLLSDSYVEGKKTGIELMIVNGYQAGGTIEVLSKMAQINI